MKLTLEKARQIKSVFLDEIERNRTIPSNMVQPFFDYYNREFKPGAFSQMPCTCSGKIWIDMVKDVSDAVNEALKTGFITSLEENLEEQEVAKKKSKKVKETVVAEDKTEQDEASI